MPKNDFLIISLIPLIFSFKLLLEPKPQLVNFLIRSIPPTLRLSHPLLQPLNIPRIHPLLPLLSPGKRHKLRLNLLKLPRLGLQPRLELLNRLI